jgi:hypothetical protein
VSKWSLQGSVAELRAKSLSGRVDIARPGLGLHDIELSGRQLAGQLFCVTRGTDSQRDNAPLTNSEPSWPLAIADAYVRGDDLVVTYKPSDDWPYTPQIYWRASTVQALQGLAGALSLLVSVQTHLLNTCPRIIVASQLDCREALRVTTNGAQVGAETVARDATIRPSTGECCIIRRLSDPRLSYVEIMPASDYRLVVTRHADDGICRVSWELFAEFLEKGVIRRSRLHSTFVERSNDLEIAGACRDAIERSALPLTT